MLGVSLDEAQRKEREAMINAANDLNAAAAKKIGDLEKKIVKLIEKRDEANLNVQNQEKTDARENADLQVAREQQARANHDLITAQRQLEALRSCTENYTETGFVTLGTTVKLKLMTVNGSREHNIKTTEFIIKIVEHDAGEAKEGFVAKDSKVGLACLGKSKGDKITVKAPLGAIQYNIEGVY